MKTIIDCETGEILERELNAKELKQQVADEKEADAIKAAAQAEAETKAAARKEILDRLGITAEEAALLLG